MKNEPIEIQAPNTKASVEPVDRGIRVCVFPHRKIAEPVKKYQDIAEEVDRMKDFINRINKHGYFGRKCLALAQPQINAENPLRYFVDKDGVVYINPKILEKDQLVPAKETCLSYPHRGPKKLKRYFKVKVEYLDNEMKKHTKQFDGVMSAIFQHEQDHFNAVYIYDK